MSTDKELRDLAVDELRQTTVGYLNSKWKPPAPAGTHWRQALDLLAQIGAVPPPPPPGSIAPPVGPFTVSGPVAYRDAAHPQEVAKLRIEGIDQQTNGITIMQWPPHDGPRWNLHDCIVQNVGHVPPTSDGTSEAGAWIGQPTDADRLILDASWEALWTGAQCHDSMIRNLKIGKADGHGGYTNPVNHIGAYLEHFTRRTTLANFEIVSTDNGINSEWWYADSTYAPLVKSEYPGSPTGKAGSCQNTFQDGRIYCPLGRTGLFLDAGTWGCVGKRLTFWGPGDAVGLPNNLAGPDPNVIVTTGADACTFLNGGRHVYNHNNQVGLVPGRKVRYEGGYRDSPHPADAGARHAMAFTLAGSSYQPSYTSED